MATLVHWRNVGKIFEGELMQQLEEFISLVKKQKPSPDELMLLNVIAIMAETLNLFVDHNKKCNMETLDFPERNVKGCDCGSDAVRETYEELEHLLSDRLDH